jgi:5-methylcytosine-specific restriction endonuclease McrA
MITKKDFKKICEMQIRTQTAYCCLCGKLIRRVDEYNIEHLQPVSRGGANDVSNWRVAHKTCNSKKGALTFEEYKLWLALEAKRNGHTK